MKSNKDNKKTKLTKLKNSAKAALPIFALFGGQGFASIRNPISLQSSKKLAGKSVVYISENSAPALPELCGKINPVKQLFNSPFAAFTNKDVTNTKNAEINVQSKALGFLKENNLFNPNKTAVSSLSGKTLNKSRKAFSHTFAFQSLTSNGTEQCVNVANYNSFIYSQFYSYSSTMSCLSYSASNTSICTNYTTFPIFSDTLISCKLNDSSSMTVSNGFDLQACQVMHQKCFGHTNLPVELMKFEVD